jgi:cytochrome c oxidase subunit 1
MTVTDTAIAETTDPATRPGDEASPTRSPVDAFVSVLTTGDHKVVGRLWIVMSLLVGGFTLVLGALVGIERTDTAGVDVFAGLEAYLQFSTLYRVLLVFGFVVPLFIGLATYLVPLQIGSPSVAFPRAAAAAFWAWLVGVGTLITAWALDGGLVPGGEPEAVELSLLAFGATVIALLLAAVVIVTTVFTQRAEGMTMDRVPLFSWSMVVAGGLWVLSLPVLLANLGVAWIDIRGEGPTLYGNGENLWGQVEWAFDQPQVFAYLIPALGVVGEVLVSAFRARQPLHFVMQGAIGAVGVLSFGAYAQTFFNPTADTTPPYVVAGLAIAVPVLVLLGGWATLARDAGGRPTPSPQLGFAVATVLAVLAAVAVGVVKVAGGLLGFLREFGADTQSWQADLDDFLDPFEDLRGSAIESGLLNAVVLAGFIGAVAGLYHWAPKLFGRRLNPLVGGVAALLILVGTLALVVPDVITGFMDQPDSLAAGFPLLGDFRDGVEVLNAISMIGAFVVFAGLALVALDVLGAIAVPGAGDGDDSGDLGGVTLEWSTTNPPPPGNFAAAPVVRSEAPLLDPPAEAATDGEDT